MLSPFTVGDYWAIAVTINDKEYPISGMVTDKVAYVYLPSLNESDPAMKILRERLCTPYENFPSKGNIPFPVKCVLQNKTNTTLPVIPLQTNESVVGCESTTPCPSPTPIPVTINVALPEQLKNLVVAYAGGDRIFIGPKDWSGSAKIGANGNTIFQIHNAKNTAKIEYYEIPACDSCAFDVAWYYFPEAKDASHMVSPPPAIPDLKTNRISAHVMKYTYPDKKSGYQINGVAYAKIENNKVLKPVISIDTECATDQQPTCNMLLDYFRTNYLPQTSE